MTIQQIVKLSNINIFKINWKSVETEESFRFSNSYYIGYGIAPALFTLIFKKSEPINKYTIQFNGENSQRISKKFNLRPYIKEIVDEYIILKNITIPNNKNQNNSDWKKLLYTALIDYSKNYHHINNSDTIKLTLKNPTKSKSYGNISLTNINKITVEDSGVDITIKHILHEMTHIKQVKNKELTTDGKFLLWKNKPIISINDYNKISHKQHSNLPFEKEANSNMENLQNFYNSQYLKQLKGKNPTLDFIIDNL